MATGLNEKYFHKAGFDADKLAAAIAKYLPKIEPAYHPSVIQSANKLITRFGLDGSSDGHSIHGLHVSHGQPRGTRNN
jgi:hypothetical protein